MSSYAVTLVVTDSDASTSGDRVEDRLDVGPRLRLAGRDGRSSGALGEHPPPGHLAGHLPAALARSLPAKSS